MAKADKPHKVSPAPVFNPDQPYGEIYGSGAEDSEPARYVQAGHYFGANRDYLRSEKGAVATAVTKAVPPPSSPADKAIHKEEMEALLADPRASVLLERPLDELAQLTREAGGPTYSGDNAAKLYTAWLLKYAVEA